MNEAKPTPGPEEIRKGMEREFLLMEARNEVGRVFEETGLTQRELMEQRAELLEALEEGRRAIGDHFAPSDCYATGPLTGDPIRDLAECPACSFIAKYDAAIAKAKGGAA